MTVSGRGVLKGVGASAASVLASPALAQSFTYQPNQRSHSLYSLYVEAYGAT